VVGDPLADVDGRSEEDPFCSSGRVRDGKVIGSATAEVPMEGLSVAAGCSLVENGDEAGVQLRRRLSINRERPDFFRGRLGDFGEVGRGES
jgi:hypothetical protein